MVKLRSPYVRRLDEIGDLQVWIVDGSYIRSNCRHHPETLHQALAAEGWA